MESSFLLETLLFIGWIFGCTSNKLHLFGSRSSIIGIGALPIDRKPQSRSLCSSPVLYYSLVLILLHFGLAMLYIHQESKTAALKGKSFFSSISDGLLSVLIIVGWITSNMVR